jgi:hypothetical protein
VGRETPEAYRVSSGTISAITRSRLTPAIATRLLRLSSPATI